MENNTIKPTAKLEQMKNEVEEIHERILEYCKNNKELDSIYKGRVIYWSQLFINPSILYFGINPGGSWGRLVEKEYLEPYQKKRTEDDPFKKDLRECFNAIKKPEYMETMVFTNRYFFATDNKNKLEKFFKIIEDNYSEIGFSEKYEVKNKQVEWTRTFINELSPKIIIAGGIYLKDKFNPIFPENKKTLYNSKNIRVLEINGFKLIVYRRIHNSMSNETKDEFKECLRKYTNEI